MSKMIRAYKYRLAPTLMQETCLNKTGRLTRFLWNRLVKTQQDALEDIKNGRRATTPITLAGGDNSIVAGLMSSFISVFFHNPQLLLWQQAFPFQLMLIGV